MVNSANYLVSSPNQLDFNGLLPLLQRLDYLLERATIPDTASENLRFNLDRTLHFAALQTGWIKSGSPLAWLQETFELSEFDLDVIAIALAPELDRRYEKLYADLQDDERCRRPSVDLALNLLCDSAIARFERRAHFAPTAPLIRQGIIQLEPDPTQVKPTFLVHELHLNSQVVRFLLNQPGLDRQLTAFCQLLQPDLKLNDLILPQDLKQQFEALVQQEWQWLCFQGRDRTQKQQAANALADALNLPLLIVDATQITDFQLVFREALFQKALLYLEGWQDSAITALSEALATFSVRTILSSEQAFRASKPLGIVSVNFPVPNFAERLRCWKQQASEVSETDLEMLADRFRFTETQIVAAIATARHTAQWKSQPLDLFAAARTQSGQDLAGLARKINSSYTWQDIVLPSDPLAQLQELCNQAKYRPIVYEDWGFGKRLSRGKGLNVLFSGLPGTGKTMAAEVIAQELQLDLYQIDLSQIVSKYIGETEKNLDRIFTAAASSNAILLFDEADALFGQRSQVQDSHDRYANIEIGYLLQKMEEYEGIAILTTNLRSNLDDAFVRRLRFMIDFPLPNERDRRTIWERVLPDAMPRHVDIDLEQLARQFEISGANIRNIALAAAFLAASAGDVLTMKHLIWATKREYQKMGKLFID